MGSDNFENLTEIEHNIKVGRPHLGIGANSYIRNAILDKDVRIGDNVRLVNNDGVENYDAPDGAFYIREGIIIVPKNGVIRSGTEI
jgi:glucose-1-phosphate adenylyltransferase